MNRLGGVVEVLEPARRPADGSQHGEHESSNRLRDGRQVVLAEYRTTFDRWPIDEVIGHYLSLIAGLLLPHATTAGTAELDRYLAGQIHPTRS